jgi:Arc/MetJ-type ribon-helix-helix transcriptional regulator
LYHNRDTLGFMAEPAISVRLDDEAARALEVLMRSGRSRSEAIRHALVEAARHSVLEQARAEAQALAANEEDRRELAEVLAFMESLSEEG